MERQAKEDVLSERNRLQTMLQLELGNTHTWRHTQTHVSLNKSIKTDGNVTHIFLHYHTSIQTHAIYTQIINSTLKLLLPWIHFTMATAEDYT